MAPEGGFADPREYFQQMFGGDAFRSIIGELAVGEMFNEAQQEELNTPSTPAVEGEESSTTSAEKKPAVNKEQMEKMQKQQQERVDKLAETLKLKLAIYTESEGDEQAMKAFQDQIKMEADKLKMESYGLELLHSIGGVYQLKAKHYLGIKGGGMPSIFLGFKQKKHIVKELWTTVKVAMDVQQAAEMISKAEEGGMEDSEKMKLEEEVTTKVCKCMNSCVFTC